MLQQQGPKGRPILSVLGSLGAVLAILLACHGYEEIEPIEVCKEAGYSIANRTFACTNNSDLANQRYRRLMSEFQCIAKAPPPDPEPGNAPLPGESYDEQLVCAQALFGMTCDEVIAAGDNLFAWLNVSPECSHIFTNVGPDGGLDGSILPDGGGCPSGSSPCENGACVDLSTDVVNCGTCGQNCYQANLPPAQNIHQTPVCQNGECVLGCSSGHATCDAVPENVCLYEIFNDPTNCNGCGLTCAAGTTCIQVTATEAQCQ